VDLLATIIGIASEWFPECSAVRRVPAFSHHFLKT
jgi:hypothetical protein